jgi:hypothetical protein
MQPNAIDNLLRIEHFPKDRYIIFEGILPDRDDTPFARFIVQEHSLAKCADFRHHVVFQSFFEDF